MDEEESKKLNALMRELATLNEKLNEHYKIFSRIRSNCLESMRELMTLNGTLNDHEKTFSRIRNEYFDVHKKIDATLNGQ